MGLIDKIIGWIDELLLIFKGYSSNYSKFLVYGLLLLIASKIFKVRLDLKTGGKK